MCELDRVFRALTENRRRSALRCLQCHGVVRLPDLAETVAEAEDEATLPTIPADRVADIYMSLYHTHVPQLEDAGLVQYDQERDCVATTRRTGDLLADAVAELDGIVAD